MNGPVSQQIRKALTPDGRPSSVLAALSEVDRKAAELQVIQDTLTAAAVIGEYTCVCGSGLMFTKDSTIEDYAHLNRWLGHHGRCEDVTKLESELAGYKRTLERVSW